MNFRELGTLYKKVRQSRGYSINDVTSDYLNKSQISKFENGNSMLLLDGFMHAVDGLNMTMSEFFLSVGNFEAGSSHISGETIRVNRHLKLVIQRSLGYHQQLSLF
ncbi:MAG: helix-turn-helix domain-containing protein [Pseudolactococcus laudensis]